MLNILCHKVNNKYFIYFPKRFFPRGVREIKDKGGIKGLINSIDPDKNFSIPPESREISRNITKKLKEEMSKSVKEAEESEEELDLKKNQEWSKAGAIKKDPFFEKYGPIAKCNEMKEIPEKMQIAAQKVFSKHVPADVKFWTRKFLLNYSQNHACEPPIDLTNLQEKNSFSNSEELNIKTKLFAALKNKEKEEKNKDSKIIDIENEKILNKEKENINPIQVEYKAAQAVAYLNCKMPYTYNISVRICEEIKNRMPEFKPTSVLDYGAGLGSSIWAAHDLFPEALRLAAVEPNRDMRRLGRFLTSVSKMKNEILWVESLTMIPGTGTERGKFDLIFLSYVLQELATSKLRLMLLDTLFTRLNDNGILVVVEPGSPKGYRFIHDFRNWIVEKPRDEASIVAPCPHHNKCPLAEKNKDWCHFSQLSYKWDRSVMPRSTKEKQIHNEKFSYLVVKKGMTPNVTYKTQEECETDFEKSFFWDRLLRPVIKKHQHTILDMCTTEGKFERRTVAKSHSSLGGYKTSRKLNWGDLWYVPYWIPNKFRKEKTRGKRLW